MKDLAKTCGWFVLIPFTGIFLCDIVAAHVQLVQIVAAIIFIAQVAMFPAGMGIALYTMKSADVERITFGKRVAKFVPTLHFGHELVFWLMEDEGEA